MKKFSLLIAVIAMACFVVPGMAAEVRIYGWADLSVDYVDHGDNKETYLVNNASNIGIRVDQQLNDTLRGFAQFEALFGLDGEGDDQQNPDSNAYDGPFLASRNSGMGLISPYGSLILGGSWNEPLKVSSIGLDPFVARNGHIGAVINRGYRAKNIVLYRSPDFNGLKFRLSKSFAEGDNKAEYGPGDLFSSDAFSANVTYQNVKSPIGDVFLGIGYRDENEYRGFGYDNKVLRVSTSYTIHSYNDKDWFTRFGFIYQQDELTQDHLDVTALLGSLQHKMGKVQLNFSYGQAEDDISGQKQSLMACGIDYRILPKFKVYLIYAASMLDDATKKQLYPFGAGGRNEIFGFDPGSDKVSSISFGMKYFFKPGFKVFDK